MYPPIDERHDVQKNVVLQIELVYITFNMDVSLKDESEKTESGLST